ncbi:hypothetical protein [Burkholderia contaminans]|uniref:hypothetical protein n=1 Tax=Burkholderia contaminans TaxID=488447 RepID=UPI001CF5A950|nr:hypothetical protein [Burkholderia contaminans]
MALTMFPFIPPDPASTWTASAERIVPLFHWATAHVLTRPLKFLRKNCQTAAPTRAPYVGRASLQTHPSINAHQTLGVIRDHSQTTFIPVSDLIGSQSPDSPRNATNTKKTLKIAA